MKKKKTHRASTHCSSVTMFIASFPFLKKLGWPSGARTSSTSCCIEINGLNMQPRS